VVEGALISKKEKLVCDWGECDAMRYDAMRWGGERERVVETLAFFPSLSLLFSFLFFMFAT
jgi:hypothetical protein